MDENKEELQNDEKVYSIPFRRHLWPEEVALKQEQKKVKRLRILMVAFVVVALVGGWLLGSVLPLSSLAPARKNVVNNLPLNSDEKINGVLQVMENDWFFADQVENIDTKLTDQALKGITTNDVDKHTEYMTADEMKQFTNSINRNYVGIGVQFLQANGINIIERVFRNSPADKAGVKAGDIMNKVNGESLTGKTTEEIKNLVQGDSGTDVTIEFIRQEQPLEITITRAAVSATAFGEILSDNTGYLQIYQFGENTTNEVKAYLDDFKNANVSNIVIDLRDNGGGYLTALQGIASYFLPKDTLAMKQVYADGTTEEIRTTDGMYDNIKKIAILVNKNTASASEVLTMALKEQHQDVTVLGVTTYGKGTVQVSRVFKDGSALKYTTSKWTSPNDVWVNGVGITPDVEVKLHEVMYTSLPKMNDTDRYAYDSVGEPVKFAQLCLDYLGYNVGRTDGYFSSQTEAALRQFETDKGITADGVLDKETFSTLYSAVVLDWNTTKTHDVQLQKAQEVLNG